VGVVVVAAALVAVRLPQGHLGLRRCAGGGGGGCVCLGLGPLLASRGLQSPCTAPPPPPFVRRCIPSPKREDTALHSTTFVNQALAHNGYSVVDAGDLPGAGLPEAVYATARALAVAGWPPVFVFVFDALWAYIIHRVWPTVVPALGPSCVYVPCAPGVQGWAAH
jgi:hypothetical protein